MILKLRGGEWGISGAQQKTTQEPWGPYVLCLIPYTLARGFLSSYKILSICIKTGMNALTQVAFTREKKQSPQQARFG